MSNIIDLSALGTGGFIIRGDAAGDQAGFSVDLAGDVNGDGLTDLIVGAPDGDDGGIDAGEAYVVFGKSGGLGTIDLTGLAPADGFVIQGDNTGDRGGFSVAPAGDVNGDGYDDLIVGAPFGDDRGADAGEAYVILGQAAEFGTIDLSAFAPAHGFVIQGDTAGDRAGYSVASAGDINGDGLDDLVVGAPRGDDAGSDAGEAYVIFGAVGLSTVVLTAGGPVFAEGFVIQGDAAGDYAGFSVSPAGDVNGDGFDDLIVGAPLGDEVNGNDGEAYVIFGKTGGFGTIDVTDLSTTDGFVIQASESGAIAGVSVSAAGDVNGDGLDDVIVGAPGDEAVYVVFGGASGFGTVDINRLGPDDGFVIQTDASNDVTGHSVSSAGDVNGDGFDDVIVGAYRNDDGGTYAGIAYVVFGKASGFGPVDLSGLAAVDGFIIRGDAAGDRAGESVSSAGDINGDGFADLIVGAPRSDDFGRDGPDGVRGGDDALDVGAAYVIFGAAPTESVTRIGSVIGQTIRGGIGDDRLDGRDGDDLLLGADGDDEVIGGRGNDRTEGGEGDDRLAGGSGDDALLGGSEADRLEGGSGNDALNGGSGGDVMIGGSGNDRLFVDSRGDRVVEYEGNGLDRVFASVGYRLAEGVAVEMLTTTSNGGARAINLTGNEFANRITGNAGANVLDGGGGADTLTGLSGNDTYRVDSAQDRIVEAAGKGADRVIASVSYGLGLGVSVEAMVTDDARATRTINLSGNDFDNRITGNAGINRLSGGAGADRLAGLAGNDQLHGGAGRDVLDGGDGADRFYFDTALDASTNMDSLAHYAVADDTLFLDTAIFTRIAAGTLAAAAFHERATAGDASDRILYDAGTGAIYYDSDGTGAAAKVLFARVAAGTALTNADFVGFSSSSARSEAARVFEGATASTEISLPDHIAGPGHLPSAMHWMDLVVP